MGRKRLHYGGLRKRAKPVGKLMIMKKLGFLAITFTILFTHSLFAQNEKEIASINRQVAIINKNLKRYGVKTLNVAEVSDEGARATYYSTGRGLYRIRAKISGEYESVVELYYQGEELIYAYEKFTGYGAQANIQPKKRIKNINERRYYFSGGNLIKQTVGAKILKPSDKAYEELKKQIEGIAELLKEAYLKSL